MIGIHSNRNGVNSNKDDSYSLNEEEKSNNAGIARGSLAWWDHIFGQRVMTALKLIFL